MLTEPNLKELCIPILQKQGANLKASCLHEAITQKMEGCAMKMLELLESGSPAFLFRDLEKNTPLHLSVDPSLWPEWGSSQQAEERVSFIDLLLRKGTKALEAVNKANQTPLQYYLSKSAVPFERLQNSTTIPEPQKELLEKVYREIHFKLLDACMHLPAVMDIKKVIYGSTGGTWVS